MKILLIKLSSLGDLLHTFPALSDLQKHYPDAEVDWVVEEAFAEVPSWHPLVKHVISTRLRRIKKQGWWRLSALKEFFSMIHTLRARKYDVIIDAQGLYKSAALALLASGRCSGFAKGASRENVAWLYQQKTFVRRDEHAISRIRELFAQTFNYSFDSNLIAYPLNGWVGAQSTTLIFVHATTWPTKHYPIEYWQILAQLAVQSGFQVELPEVNAEEQARALAIKANLNEVKILPRMSLNAIKERFTITRAVISVDTGLAHIAAALSVPTLTLYGPTNPKQVGTQGAHQEHLSAHFSCAPCLQKHCTHPERIYAPTPPCFKTIPPKVVWEQFQHLLAETRIH